MIPAAQPIIGKEEVEAVLKILTSGQLAQGPEVAAFEEDFSAIVGGRPCVAVNSGTSALHIALLALGLNRGDEVIVPSFSFAATANAVVLAGGLPVFADIDPVSMCIDVEDAERRVTSRTKAIIPVHLYGHPAEMRAVESLSERYGLWVLEDAAQAHGASIGGRPVGTWGDSAAFSFYPTKNMTSGEGGMIVFADDANARRARMLRNQGMERRYHNELVGLNNRMTDLHAAIGRVQLRRLGDWNRRRVEIAHEYDERLRGVVTPVVRQGCVHVFHQYTVRVHHGVRDRFADELKHRGVGSGVYYPVPIHALPSFNLDLDLPETALAASEVLSLPVHPALTDEDVDVVIRSVNDVSEALS